MDSKIILKRYFIQNTSKKEQEAYLKYNISFYTGLKTWVCKRTRALYIHARTRTHTHTHTHARARTHTHTHTHTHTCVYVRGSLYRKKCRFFAWNCVDIYLAGIWAEHKRTVCFSLWILIPFFNLVILILHVPSVDSAPKMQTSCPAKCGLPPQTKNLAARNKHFIIAGETRNM